MSVNGIASMIQDVKPRAAARDERESIVVMDAFPAGTAGGFTGVSVSPRALPATSQGPIAGEDFDGGSGHEDVIGLLVPA